MASSPDTSTAFWGLMTRWQVPDAEALVLIDQPPSATGKRARFALTTDQSERLALLREIDRQAGTLHDDVGAWLRAKSRSAAFGRLSPLAHMCRRGKSGIEDVLRHLHAQALSSSLRGPRQGS